MKILSYLDIPKMCALISILCVVCAIMAASSGFMFAACIYFLSALINGLSYRITRQL